MEAIGNGIEFQRETEKKETKVLGRGAQNV
jgi:hypothetical protein